MILKKVFLMLISGYQYLISPMFPPSCRYSPSCSEYTKQAVLTYGAFKGIWMGIKRLSRCHPGCEGGYDPLPEKTEQKTQPNFE